LFYIIQSKIIILGAKLTVSRSSNMNESKLLNEIQITNFDDIIFNPQNIHHKTNICSLLQHITDSINVMAFGINHATQINQILVW
jgi:hypothetical protein